MVSEKIRKLRKGVQKRKQQAAERREKARFGLALKKSKVRESGPVQEAAETKRELGLLSKEVGGPVARAARSAKSAAGDIRESAGQLDNRLADVREIERDTLGMAGEDFDMDLEVVDDLERGERMRGMGSVGFETSFEGRRMEKLDELRAAGREKGEKAGETAFENRVKREAKKERLEELLEAEGRRPLGGDPRLEPLDGNLDSIDDDILGEL